MIDFLINAYVKQLDERNNDELLYTANEALKCSILVLRRGCYSFISFKINHRAVECNKIQR